MGSAFHELLQLSYRLAQLQQMKDVATIRRILQQNASPETLEERLARYERATAGPPSPPPRLSPRDVDSLAAAAEEARAQAQPLRQRRRPPLHGSPRQDDGFYVENDLPDEGYVESEPAPEPPPVSDAASAPRAARVPNVSPVPTAESAALQEPVNENTPSRFDLPSILKNIAQAQQRGMNIQEWLDQSFTAEEQARLNPERMWEIWQSVANLTQLNNESEDPAG